MMGTCENPPRSSAFRIAPTRPSIMSEGATMSAPAFACETALFARISSVASLSTSVPFRIPQWPWSVYSQKQTSVTTMRPGTASLIARTAVWMIPLSE